MQIYVPANGSTVSGSVKVAVSASDADGIAVVDFRLDGVWRYSDTTSPYSWSFDTTLENNGLHSVMATAIDTEGGYASDSISVYVDNGGGGICKVPPCPMAPMSAGILPTTATTVGSEPAGVAEDTGLWSQGSNHILQVDVRKGVRDLTSSETSAGILGPGFTDGELHAYTSWRLVLRDWVAGSAGTLWTYFLKVQETSDPTDPDTDGDGLADDEYFVKGTDPTRADTDRDGFRDDVDRFPLADAFVQVHVVDTSSEGTDDFDDGTPGLEPVVAVTYHREPLPTPSVSYRPRSTPTEPRSQAWTVALATVIAFPSMENVRRTALLGSRRRRFSERPGGVADVRHRAREHQVLWRESWRHSPVRPASRFSYDCRKGPA